MKSSLFILFLFLEITQITSFSLFSKPKPEECPFTWTLYPNGADQEGTSVVLPSDLHLKSEAELNAWAAEQVGYEKIYGKSHDGAKHEPCYECSIYDATGDKITHCSQLNSKTNKLSSITSSYNYLNGKYESIIPKSINNDEMMNIETINNDDEIDKSLEVWVVAPHRWFIYPLGSLGRAVEIPRVPPPRGESQPIIVESISDRPRAFHLHNFLTFEEADELIEHAINNKDPVYGLQRSTTGVEDQVAFNEKRTSENAFDVSSPAALKLKRRALDVLGMLPYDERLTDGLQVLRYNKTAAYNNHLDYLDDNKGGHDYDSEHEGSNRFATILFYLSDVDEGGETVFPMGQAIDDGVTNVIDGVRLKDNTVTASIYNSRHNDDDDEIGEVDENNDDDVDDDEEVVEVDQVLELFSSKSWQARMIRQCRTKLAVKPKRAHAILFYSQGPNGKLDRASLHGACPVLNGTKWAANLWIWNKIRLGYPGAPRKAGADAFDPKKAVSRDRLLENNNNQQNTGGAVNVKFVNQKIQNAVLYWEETKFADFPINSDIPVNSFTGHQWYVRDENSQILAHWIVGMEPFQTFNLEPSA